MGGMFKFSPVIAGKFFMQTGITMAHPFFHLLIPVLLLRFQIFIPPIPLPLLIIPFVARPRRALRPDSLLLPTARSVPSCRCTATRRRSARLRSWCLSTDRTIPPASPEARSLPISPSMAPPSPPRTPLFPSPPPPPPTRPSLYPLGQPYPQGHQYPQGQPYPQGHQYPQGPRWRRPRSCSGRSTGRWCRWRWATRACRTCRAPRRWPFP